MNLTAMTVEYEDGTVKEGIIGTGLLLSNAEFVDHVIHTNDPALPDLHDPGRDD